MKLRKPASLLLLATTLALGGVSLVGCSSNELGEGVEEAGDEVEDAADEVEDELD